MRTTSVIMEYTAPLRVLTMTNWNSRATALESYVPCPGIDWHERIYRLIYPTLPYRGAIR